MFAVVLEGGHVAARIEGKVGRRARAPEIELLVDAHLGREVRVVLVEPRARSHVQQMLHAGALEAGADELRDVRGHESVHIERAAADEDAGHRGRDGLRHGHQQVARVTRHVVVVPLHHDASVV